MNDFDKIEKELSAFLDWPRVKWVEDAFVVECNVSDLRSKIRNITRKPGRGWFVLDTDFSVLPISFLIDMSPSGNTASLYHQTWTWRGALHRGHSKPAVVHWNGKHPAGNIVNKKWFKEGEPYRDNDLPCNEIAYNYEVLDMKDQELIVEKWDAMVSNWGHHELTGYPLNCMLFDGQQIRRRDTGQLHSPERDVAARTANVIKTEYNVDKDIKYFPHSVKAVDFQEIYDNGKLVKRSFNDPDVDIFHFSVEKTMDQRVIEKAAEKNVAESPELYNPAGKFMVDGTAEFMWAAELLNHAE